MRLLMDTNVIIRAIMGDLGQQGADLLEDTGNTLYYSPVSIWEMVIKQRTGKLNMPVEPGVIRQRLEERGCREAPVTSRHALATGALADINKDPFDRMLVAQSIVEGMTLITTDRLLAAYAAEVMVVE
jgi:PIN domain nuclease of toxin-antitoxin system